MPDPILSDEEVEAQRVARLQPAILTPSERDAINAEFASLALERETARAAVQAHYDAGKGRAPAKAWTEEDAERFAKGSGRP